MITLIGHGFVGTFIVRMLQVKGIEYNWLNHHEIRDYNLGNVIINAAGYTGKPNVDACEINKADTLSGNVVWPLALEQMAGNKPVIHITSGCVYTGYKEGGWLETDEPNFDFSNGSFYSGTKALVQQLMKPYLNKSYLLRIRMPFCGEHHPQNLLTKYEKYEKLISFENSLSNLDDVALVATHFAQTLPDPGIYNLCNPGSLSTIQIASWMGLVKPWFTEEQFNSAIIAPRSNCVLNTNKLEKIYPIRSIYDAMHQTLEEYKRV